MKTASSRLKSFVLSAAVVAAFAAARPGVSGDVRDLVENNYGAAAARETALVLSSAAAAGLPTEFLRLRIRESVAKKAAYADLARALAAHVKTLSRAKIFCEKASSAGYKKVADDAFTVRVADALDAGLPGKTFEAMVAAPFRVKSADSLSAAIFVWRETVRILGAPSSADEFVLAMKNLRPDAMAKIASVSSGITASSKRGYASAVAKFISDGAAARLASEIENLAAAGWKAETESEISAEKKFK